MKTLIQAKANNKRIVIAGFGKEGQSTLKFLQNSGIPNPIAIADSNAEIAQHPLISTHQLTFIGGKNFEQALNPNDFIIKSPGVKWQSPSLSISSQTALFMERYGKQIIGISGTKGKSTTATMTYRMLQACGKNTLLAGNIGIPPFDIIDKITDDSLIVQELSAHQLADISHSCRYAMLLNLMPEHLDFFGDTKTYYAAKLRLFSQQDDNDPFRHLGNTCKAYTSYTNTHPYCSVANNILKISDGRALRTEDLKYLQGAHHLDNISALINLAFALHLDMNTVLNAIKVFKPLAHRQEILSQQQNSCIFINDSISTVPQATIAALKSFPHTTHLILGGTDRGIKYEDLLAVLHQSTLQKVYFLGAAGKRMWKTYQDLYPSSTFKALVAEKLQDIEKELYTTEKACVLLSPAAASYDYFKNFEERGNYFRSIFQKKINNYLEE